MRRLNLLVYGFFLLVAVGLTWPLVTVMNTAFIGSPESDAYEYARHIWWYTYALRQGYSVFSHPFLAHPDGLPGLWLWAIPLQSFPAWIYDVVLPLPVAYNLMALTRLALNGWAMFWLVRQLTGRIGPALLAGLIFMTYPTIQGHLFASHLGLLALWPAPLYVGALLRLSDRHRPRDFALTALWFVLAVLGSNLLLIFLVAPLTLLIFFSADDRAHMRRIFLAGLLGALVSLIFVAPAVWEQLTSPAAVREVTDVRFSADLLALVSPSFFHPLFSTLDYPRRVLGTNLVEGTAYVGLLAGVLAVLGVVLQRPARKWLLLALVAWVLSLGPLLKVFDDPLLIAVDDYASYVTLPWAALANLPVLEIVRTPTRFNFTVGFAVAVMAGYGLAWVWDRIRWRWVLLVALLLGVAFEYHIFWVDGMPHAPTQSAAIPGPIRAIATDDTVRAVMNLPWDNLLVAKAGMYLQTGHQKPLVAGFVSRRTPVSPAKLSLLQNTLDPALLNDAGVDVLILHRGYDDVLEATVQERLGAPEFADARLMMWRLPDPAAAPEFRLQPFSTDRVERTSDAYVFAPESGWLPLELSAQGPAYTLQIDGDTIAENPELVPIRLQPGYHTITLALDDPCPYQYALRFNCNSLTVSDALFDDFVSMSSQQRVQFDRGLVLDAAQVLAGEVWLSWHFEEGLDENTVRFVQVFDAAGELAAQSDTPLGPFPAGAQRVEAVPFDVSLDDKVVYVGWYTFPDLVRVSVLDAVVGAPDGWVQISR